MWQEPGPWTTEIQDVDRDGRKGKRDTVSGGPGLTMAHALYGSHKGWQSPTQPEAFSISDNLRKWNNSFYIFPYTHLDFPTSFFVLHQVGPKISLPESFSEVWQSHQSWEEKAKSSVFPGANNIQVEELQRWRKELFRKMTMCEFQSSCRICHCSSPSSFPSIICTQF